MRAQGAALCNRRLTTREAQESERRLTVYFLFTPGRYFIAVSNDDVAPERLSLRLVL